MNGDTPGAVPSDDFPFLGPAVSPRRRDAATPPQEAGELAAPFVGGMFRSAPRDGAPAPEERLPDAIEPESGCTIWFSGLHPADTDALLDALAQLRERGNSLFVVEHDVEMAVVLDLGLGAELRSDAVHAHRLLESMNVRMASNAWVIGGARTHAASATERPPGHATPAP